MKKKLLRIGVLAGILTIGGVFAAKIPEAVESFLPSVETIKPTEIAYFPTVSANGYLSVDESGNWNALVSVNESGINAVEIGQTAALSGAAIDSSYYTATVTGISDVAHLKAEGVSSQTVVDVTLKLDNPDERLRVGYTVQADIKTAEERVICLLPYSVICQDDAGEYVYVLSNNTAVKRNIKTGVELADGTEVVSGIRITDDIVANPTAVSDNSLVKTW